MDTSDTGISFDEQGVCNHCRRYDERSRRELFRGEEGRRKLEKIIAEIKRAGRHKEYDCIIGLSGGVDSTYVAYVVKQYGLRPLAVHLDNGWDTEIAVSNINNIVTRLGIDLHTHVINWQEFKDLQLAFLRASVVNAEIPTDHAIVAIMYGLTRKYGVNYIITGGNIVTESMMPRSWFYDSRDWRHVKAIHRRYGNIKLKTFPKVKGFHFLYYTFFKRVKFFPILNYLDYDKQEAIKVIEQELGWKNYGLKHHESIYTRFYQTYILPHKFNIDKRRVHLSSLIVSGQMTREEALREMAKPPLPPDRLRDEKEYVIKKLGLKPEDFEQIMSSSAKDHREYPNNEQLVRKFNFVVRLARNLATLNR
jgi:N-acetyl sugar amidotransferase